MSDDQMFLGRTMDVKNVLMSNYLPYAKGSIISRAIVQLDGFKPVQRRTLYAMYEMGLGKKNAARAKSVKVIGKTMGEYHPHGDSSIYEAIVLMTKDREGLNLPYIDSNGSFGKVYSTMQYSASRYTEVKLEQIANEIFDCIDEDAVDFVPTFDNGTEEPAMLPVKFANILVNPNKGIAVGMGSNIPSFDLASVCTATQEYIKGNVKTPEELMMILGVPEFSTGGFVHADRASLIKLAETGRGTFRVSGHATIYSDSIVIDEVPYGSTCEGIKDAIIERVKGGALTGVAQVYNEIGLKGMLMTVKLKRNVDPMEVYNELRRTTPLMNTITFDTKVIINNRCETLGLLELLSKWVEFRVDTIRRIYRHRIDSCLEREHQQEVWDKIINDLDTVVGIILKNNLREARELLMEKYKLDDIQADYLLSLRLSSITKDRAEKGMRELEELRKKIKELQDVESSDKKIYDIIIEDQQRIKETYGRSRRTRMANLLSESELKKEEPKISDAPVTIVITESMNVKRLAGLRGLTDFELPENEKELLRVNMKNDDYLLVFHRDGTVYKILANNIDSTRGGFRENLCTVLGIANTSDILWIDAAGDYSGYFNLVYANGRGYRAYYSKAQGKRMKYKGVYPPCEPGEGWTTRHDKFFMVTRRRKAAYCSLEFLGLVTKRSAFKVARVSPNDSILGLTPYDMVPDKDAIDLSKYNKGYTVKIGEDKLW